MILSLAIIVFVAGYVIFSSLSTSLDFQTDKVTHLQTQIREEHEQILSTLARSQGSDVLVAAATGLNLVEIVLADGYVDVRPTSVSMAENLARRP